MKVLAINGSPHKDGTTYAALQTVTEVLEAEGIETEIYQIGSKAIQGCTACGYCREKGKCRFADGVNEVAEKMKTMDGLILSTPTYYGGIAGGAKCFYDRLFYAGVDVQCKPGAVVAVARRSGAEDAYHQLSSYLTLAGAILTPTVYWNAAFGTTGAEMLQDEEGVSILENVGKSMSWLLKIIQTSKNSLPAPDLIKKAKTNFIR